MHVVGPRSLRIMCKDHPKLFVWEHSKPVGLKEEAAEWISNCEGARWRMGFGSHNAELEFLNSSNLLAFRQEFS